MRQVVGESKSAVEGSAAGGCAVLIAIVDYGMGNLGSILNMLERVGATARISGNADEIAQADRVILPGVGAFDTGMQNLSDAGLIQVLTRVAHSGIPVLGICLGMHVIMERSEEGSLPGLGWVKGEVIRFRFAPQGANLRVPHMGWNTVTLQREDPLLAGSDADRRFYFVHSFHVVCSNPSDVVGTTEYGYLFPSVLRHGNIMGTQFHPEKSHRFGMQLLDNFARLT